MLKTLYRARMEFDNGLEGLLQKSEELTANLNDGTDLPRVRRNLGQVLFPAFKKILTKYFRSWTPENDSGQKQQRMEPTRSRLKLLSFSAKKGSKSQMCQTDLKISQRREIWSHWTQLFIQILKDSWETNTKTPFYQVLSDTVSTWHRQPVFLKQDQRQDFYSWAKNLDRFLWTGFFSKRYLRQER